MSAWQTLANSLCAKGGGPLHRKEFDEEITTDHASLRGVIDARRYGIFWVQGHSIRNRRYSLSVKGWMWCAGAVQICPGRAGPMAESSDEKRLRLERLFIDAGEAFDALSRLTVRQREVLGLYAKGYTYREIGDRLGLTSEGTKACGRRILVAMGCDRIIEAAMLMSKAGLA